MINAILLVPLALLALYVVFLWVLYPMKFMTVDLYKHVRYTRHGICPKCKLPATFVDRPTDQTYGTSRVRKLVCSCGSKTIPIGDRSSADWADF